MGKYTLTKAMKIEESKQEEVANSILDQER